MGKIRVIPDYLPARVVKAECGSEYKCPICQAQTVEDAEDVGWIRCPVLQKHICLGCYIDITGICNQEDFEDHPYYDDLVKLAKTAHQSPSDVRTAYLKFQLVELEKQTRRIKYERPPEVIRNYLLSLLKKCGNR